MKTFHIISTAYCPARETDSAWIYDYMIANDYVHTKQLKNVDFVFITTCAAYGEIEDCSADAVEYYYHKKSEQTKMVVLGCLPVINPKSINGMPDIISLPPKDIKNLDKYVNPTKNLTSIPFPLICKYFPPALNIRVKQALTNDLKNLFYIEKNNHHLLSRAKKLIPHRLINVLNEGLVRSVPYKYTYCKIKISDGCAGNCSYCAVKFSIGNIISRPKEEILQDFKRGLKKGYVRFHLVSQDTGSYGQDIQTNIIELLQRILKDRSDFEILLGGINPNFFLENYGDYINILDKSSGSISNFRVTFQSGSNKILQAMNRSYDIHEVVPKLVVLKKKFPNLELETDIIVGFPGETEDDFRKTIQLLCKVKFSQIFVYAYREKLNTVASNLDGKISMKTIVRRIDTLNNIQSEFGKMLVMY